MLSGPNLLKRALLSRPTFITISISDGTSTSSSKIHNDSRKSIAGTFKKMKDTVLVIEATKGPWAKAACGVAQGAATAALVYGTGTGILNFAKLFQGHKALIRMPRLEELDEETKKRIAQTYFHMGTSILMSSLTALLSFRLFRNKPLIIKMGERPLIAIGIGVITPLMMATIVRFLPSTKVKVGDIIPYGLKEVGNLLYAGSIGLLAAPLYLLGGQSIHRAIFITAGTLIGLQGVAYTAPTDTLSRIGQPLALAINAVILSFILTLLLRRSHSAFLPLFRFTMHGGILIYSTHYCYVAQVMRDAAKSPTYDPVNGAMALTMDLLSIYGRHAFLLPPHFTLSRQHHFIVNRGRPQAVPKDHEPSYKPGNDDM